MGIIVLYMYIYIYLYCIIIVFLYIYIYVCVRPTFLYGIRWREQEYYTVMHGVGSSGFEFPECIQANVKKTM